MPRFFIDTSDQKRFVRDEIGIECKDVEAAKTAAVDALPDMARPPGGPPGSEPSGRSARATIH